MRSMSVREIKAEFLEVLAIVRRGERIGVACGRSGEPVAMIVPYEPKPVGKREIGFLDGKVTIEFTVDYDMTEDELLEAATEEDGWA